MFNLFNLAIPQQLLTTAGSVEDINILIGENGSGKSSLLLQLANHYVERGTHVIAIANTIYDKFRLNKKEVKLLLAAEGRRVAKKSIISSLQLMAGDDLKRMSSVANALNFIGFEPRIGFRLKGVNVRARDSLADSSFSPDMQKILLSYLNQYVHRLPDKLEIFNVNFQTSTFQDFHDARVLDIFLYEKELRKAGVFREIEIFLYKASEPIPLNQASSGELTLVATLIFLTVAIAENSVVLVDEPENSLHPRWQIEYVKLLVDLLYLYQPKIIIASHSPLILNGAEVNLPRVLIFKGVKGVFTIHTNESTNVEEIYQDVFNVTTPRNRFVSERVVEKMNALTNKQISLGEFDAFVEEMKQGSYDEQQRRVFDGIKQMAQKIAIDAV
jgi:predicted ATPase